MPGTVKLRDFLKLTAGACCAGALELAMIILPCSY